MSVALLNPSADQPGLLDALFAYHSRSASETVSVAAEVWAVSDVSAGEPADHAAVLPAQAYHRLFHAAPVDLLVIACDGLVMVDANQQYLDSVGMPREQIVGQHVFDVFPNNPDRPGYDQRGDLRLIFDRVVKQRTEQVVENLRYDIPDAGGGFDVRWWNTIDVPIIDADDTVTAILHYSEDVTERVRAREELAAATSAKNSAAMQVAALADVALALTSADSVDQLEDIIIGRGVGVIGADGGAVVSSAEDGRRWRLVTSESLGEHVQRTYGDLPYDSLLPAPTVARTGERILLATLEEQVAFDASMTTVFEDTGRRAWAFLPLTVQGATLGSLAVSWSEEHTFSRAELELLDALAAQCAQALHRIQRAEAERATAVRIAELATALQQAMLTPPPRPDYLDVAVRYTPAVGGAQVGGDWYDAFVQPDGATVVIIGDVAGHDSQAAARMGQLRGLLRTLTYDMADQPPATVLSRFEQVARGLGVDCMATAILAHVDPPAAPADARVVQWTNAGNPPPVLLHPDGSISVLDPKSDLLLGVDPSYTRHGHRVELPVGATLLMYTDGLIERRDASIDEGIRALRESLAGLVEVPLEQLCDTVLQRMSPHLGEDDVALIAVRPTSD